MTTLVLTCAGGRMMPLLAAWLRRSCPDYKLVGLDANPRVVEDGVEGFDDVALVPPATDARYLEVLGDRLRSFGPCVVVPGSDEEALAMAGAQDVILESGGAVALTARDQLADISDKYGLAKAIETLGSGGRAVLRADDPAQARRAIAELGGPESPVVLKPSRGRGRRGVYVVCQQALPAHEDLPPSIGVEDIDQAYANTPRPDMAMPFVEGRSFTVDVLANKGEAVQIVAREWLENWRFPFPGQRVGANFEIESMVRRIASRFNLHGLVDFDLIVPAEGPPVLLEVNPRPSGSCVVTVAAGIPLFRQLVELAMGGTPKAVNVPEAVIGLRELERVDE